MKYLEQSMRWYGPLDPVPLQHIRQAGATGVVNAIHEVELGESWDRNRIRARKMVIEEAGLSWSVVESVNVHESIKTGDKDRDRYIDNYRKTLENLGEEGITTVCYNFMPVLDWSRTDLSYELDNGARALRFERLGLIAFDLFILKRPDAYKDYTERDLELAKNKFEALSETERAKLLANVTLGLPGGSKDFSLVEIRTKSEKYRDIDSLKLKANLKYFLENIVEVAERYSMKLCIHPDDPPFSIFGLPRIVSTEQDAMDIIDSVPSPSNGLCLCTGSYGVRLDNDLPGMTKRLAKHIHFIHLRNVQHEEEGNFYEADHLDGSVDMFSVMEALVAEQQTRTKPIPMRPDHGHAMLDDLSKVTYPGYTAIGRLKGLAELRGLERGILGSIMG